MEQPSETASNSISEYYKEDIERKLAGYNTAVYLARNGLFIAAGIFLLSVVVPYAAHNQFPPTLDLIFFVFVFCALIGMAVWTSKKPHTALITGAVIYCAYILIYVLFNAYQSGAEGILQGIYRGIIFKVLILGAIAKPIRYAREMQKAKEEIDGM
jgi:uncharacterized membrane protein YozB (DUF420 family)